MVGGRPSAGLDGDLREKLQRQRAHLRGRGRLQAELLTGYLEQLQWNDETNQEGRAAKVCFNALFGMEFTRPLFPNGSMLCPC